MHFSGLAGGAAALIVARVVSAVFQAVTLGTLAATAGPRGFGEFFGLFGIWSAATAVLGFGLNTRALRLSAEEEPGRVSGAMVVVRVGTAILCGAIVLLSAVIFWPGMAPLVTAAVITYGICEFLAEFTQTLLLGRHHQWAAAGFQIARRAFALAGLPLGAALDGLAGALLAIIATSAAITIVAVTVSAVGTQRPNSVLRLLRSSVHYWAQAFWSGVQQLDTTIVQVVRGAFEAGAYAAASKLLSPLSLASSALFSVFVPALSKESDPAKRIALLQRIRLTISGYALLLLLAAPVLGWLLPVVLGEGYAESRVLVACFAVGAALNALAQVNLIVLFASGAARAAARATLASTIVGGAVLLAVALTVGGNWLGAYPVAAYLTLLIATWIARRPARPSAPSSLADPTEPA